MPELSKYEFEVTNGASGFPQLMTIRSGKFNGFSRSAFEIDNEMAEQR